jgi:hypothetical protein
MRLRFYIDSGSGETEIFPKYDKVIKKWALQPDQVFHRVTVDRDFTVFNDDFDLIDAAAFDTEFEFIIKEDDNGTLTDFYTGIFRKTDLAEVNIDDKSLKFKTSSKDKYEAILAALDKEVDLFDLAPEISEFNYKKLPLLQVYIPYAAYISNYQGSDFSELPVTTPIELTADIENIYKFRLQRAFTYVIGDATVLTPDVSGIYDNTTGQRSDGVYQLTSINLGGGDFQWVIRDVAGAQTVRYEAPVNEFPFPSDQSPFNPQTVFTSVADPAVQCKASRFLVYARVLTDLEEVLGNPTDPIPANDIVPDNFGYTHIYSFDPLFDAFFPSVENQSAPTRWGKIRDSATNFAGQYLTRPGLTANPSAIQNLPVNNSEWKEFGLWFDNNVLTQLLNQAGAVDLTSQAFHIYDVLAAFLADIDPDLTHTADSNHSEFLYGAINPISADARRYLMITPKSNIKVGDYDKPAQTATITLGETLNFLRYAFNLWWFIDDNNRFVLEHYKYFDQGKSYLAENIGIDATAQLEGRSGKPWDYQTNIFSYEKETLPDQITLKWMDQTYRAFRGYAIDVLSNYVEKGNIEERVVGLFTPDIDFIYSFPESVSDDGFAAVWCSESGGIYTAPFFTIGPSPDDYYYCQNAFLSWIFLADKYHRDGLPGASAKINNMTVVASSVKRSKVQEAVFPLPDSFDPQEMIKTGLGNGLIKEVETQDFMKTAKYKVAYVTE